METKIYRYEFIAISRDMKLVIGEAYMPDDEEKVNQRIIKEGLSLHTLKKTNEDMAILENFVKWRYV